MPKVKAVTVRFPEEVLEAARELKKEDDSFNSFVVDSVKARLQDLETKRWYDSFTRLGQMTDTDVEFAFDAQSEVVLDGD